MKTLFACALDAVSRACAPKTGIATAVRPRLVATVAAATLALLGAGHDDKIAAAGSSDEPRLVLGESKPMGAGTVSSWIRTTAHGDPTAIGVSFDDDALTKLGPAAKETVLALPPSPGLSVRTVVINWNPQGHPPAHVYDVPHFDFHFYTIDEATRMAIAFSPPGGTPTPAPNLVPTGFRTDGSTIPMMGMHFVPADQPEFHGGKFTATPIYGYWKGHLAFVESMITLDYLQSHPSLSSAFPQPSRFENSGLYPTQWSASYDSATHRYSIALVGLAAAK